MNIQIIISIVTMIASCGVAWGVVKQQLKQFDERLDALETDNKTNRELLIEIKTKVDLILEGSIKKKKQELQNETSMRSFFEKYGLYSPSEKL